MREIVLEVNGKEYKVKIKEFGVEKAFMNVNGIDYEVNLKDLGTPELKNIQPVKRVVSQPATPSTPVQPAASTQKPKPATSTGGNVIVAPLPGLILDILVNVGDSVKVGQDVLIMEAMKMENEVQATVEGVVKEIKVNKGDNVYEGDVLIVLE